MRVSVSAFCTRVGRPCTPTVAAGSTAKPGSAGPPESARTTALPSPER